jgi:hypothetical protein
MTETPTSKTFPTQFGKLDLLINKVGGKRERATASLSEVETENQDPLR